MTILLAMDRRPSARRRDVNGFLHVEISNISKANVCPYYGSEIPDARALGLDLNRIYELYRSPDELARAAATFNNIPLLSDHVLVDPMGLPEELIIGSTGTDAVFDAPYLRNSLVVWCATYQDAIESERQRELSCSYRYRADMTAGVTEDGLQYDGVMRDIVGNHVALVIEGRAGPDVMVGDDIMKLKSRTALMISGAVQALVRPKLAVDAKVDIAPALEGVRGKSIALDGATKKLASRITKIVKPHLAADAELDAEELATVIAAVQAIEDDDEDEIGEDEKSDDDDDDEKKGKKKAEDEKSDDDDGRKAMDSVAVRRMIAAAERRGAANVAAIEVAKRDVAPFVGEVVGMDSADAIYRLALDAAKVDLTDVPAAAFKSMIKMLTPPSGKPMIAQDKAAVATHRSEFAKRYPNAAKLVRS